MSEEFEIDDDLHPIDPTQRSEAGKRWVTGPTSSITVQLLDGNTVKLGIEGRDDVDRAWLDGAWAYLTPASFSSLIDALTEWRNTAGLPKDAPK